MRQVHTVFTTALHTLAALGLATASASAWQCSGGSTTWSSSPGGPYSFGDPNHWSQGVPGAGNYARFVGQGPTLIQVATPRAVCGAYWGDGDWTLTGATLSPVVASGYQQIGMAVNSQSGTVLTLDGIAIQSGNTTKIGAPWNSTGTIRVTGANSLLHHSTLDSPGYVAIGSGGLGVLVVDNGGTVTCDAQALVGDWFQGQGGMLEVAGAGSSFEAGMVAIGHRCPGSLVIKNGGLFRSVGKFFAGALRNGANVATANILVRDPGSRLELQTASGWTAIGRFGEADMLVENGAQVVSGIRDVNLGEQEGSRGELTVQGVGSSWVMSNPTQGFFIGRKSLGTATILSGARIESPGITWIGYMGVALGTLRVSDAGSLFAGATIVVGRDQLIEPFVRGHLEVSNGATARATGFIKVHGEGTLELHGGTLDTPLVDLLDGTLRGSGTITGELRNGGRLRPGNGTAGLLVQGIGGYTQVPEGVLEIGISGTLAGVEHDQLNVTSAAWITGGTLDVRFENGFLPALGDSFEIMTYPSGGQVGSFSSVTAQGLPAGLTLVPNYGLDRLELFVEEIASAYCYCASQSPCGNSDGSAGCVNGTGAGGLMSASGSRIVANDDLVLRASGLPPLGPGLFFMGSVQTQVPFRNGQLCVGAGSNGLHRFSVSSSGSGGVLESGPGLIKFSITRFSSTGRITAGQTWNFQAWYRDPSGPCGQGSNLTNALEVTFVL